MMGQWAEQIKRYATFATGLLECICFAGIIFGWASLVFVLKADRYFLDLCTPVNGTGNSSSVEGCTAQDERFSLIFTIASFFNNFMTLPNGFLYDRFGTTVIRAVGITLYMLAMLLIAFSSADAAFLLFPALCCVSVGGIILLMTNIQVGNLFGSKRSTIITLYNGAFDSSSAIFLLVKILYEHGLTIKSMFLFMASCSVLHILRTIFLLPRKHIPYPLPENYTYGVTCGVTGSLALKQGEGGGPKQVNAGPRNGSEGQNANSIPREEDDTQKALLEDGKVVVKDSGRLDNEPSFRSCIFSSLFFWHLVWLSVMQLRHYLFIGTLNPMLTHLANNDPGKVSTFTNAFAFTQLCGILCAPWNGMIMDRHKHKRAKKDGTPQNDQDSDHFSDLRASIMSLAITALQCILFSLCAAIPVLEVQYASFIFQVLNRSFLYGGNAAFIAITFPIQHFGKIYGMVMSLSALISLLQYPCFALIKGPLLGDPLYVNIGLLIFILLAFVHPVNVYLHCRRKVKSDVGALEPKETQDDIQDNRC
ncbi:equilibrative nucleobase transporter 1 [Latimeria chalumnae]|uniref:equilibrative nucleobase transporter 1 n=1 Tax=Latimeria chalumnae TaxID=7897 RepID=UPI0006D92838|nr:PREDICTED: solute carrier family 43 member 3 [Latimeria chalumnae]|eukprot:XP_014353408.1 PREDICTED: solute carrier family 43 member 3 [Latimeria chalumnae]